MALERIGINFSSRRLADESALAEDLEELKSASPDFVEVGPHGLGVILGGRLNEGRAAQVEKVLASAGHAYTVHAPHALDLMDLGTRDLQRDALETSVRFAARIGAPVVVCHAGKRVSLRDSRRRLDDQLAAERTVLRELGEIAYNLGVTIAVENSYPEPPIVRGTTYAYAAWPSGLAGQVAAVEHQAVGICLDVGHAAVASSFFGSDLLKECAVAAPLVRHVHLHDNLGYPDLTEGGESRVAERLAYGIGDLHLPPGSGAIPLEKLFENIPFPQARTCCVELYPGLRHLAKETLAAAREFLKPAHDEPSEGSRQDGLAPARTSS